MQTSLLKHKGLLISMLVLSLLSIPLAGFATDDHNLNLHGIYQTSSTRHRHDVKVPEKYRGLRNPFWTDIDAIFEGREIYNKNCFYCHGFKGRGDGPVAFTSIDPKPFNFEDTERWSEMGDDYLFWRVMDGGGFPPFNSIMPAFKDRLTEDEIWKVLSYVNAISRRKSLDHSVNSRKPAKGIDGSVEHSHNDLSD